MRMNEHGGNIYKMMRQSGGQQYLDYSANINPLGLADSVRKTIVEHIDAIVHYPDTEGTALKKAIATHYGVMAETIVLGNGAVELMYVLGHVLRPRRIVTLAPAFSEYERTAEVCGAKLYHIALAEENGFGVIVEKIVDQLQEGDLLFLGNPNNPTGTMLRCEEIRLILEVARTCGAMVAVDESFIDFVADSNRYTVRYLVGDYDNLIVLHSLTKFYAIPGLRLGFAIVPMAWARRLERGKDPWNVNTLAQAAGCAALADHAYQVRSRAMVSEEKDHFYQEIAKIEGLHPFVPSVNFMLVKITKDGLDAPRLKEVMAEQEQILIRDCSRYKGLDARFFRVAVKSRKDNLRLTEALKRVVGEMV